MKDAELAKQILLSKYVLHDTYIWPYTRDSKYAVKYGYWVATHYILHLMKRELRPLAALWI